jgi:hypothetical protein
MLDEGGYLGMIVFVKMTQWGKDEENTKNTREHCQVSPSPQLLILDMVIELMIRGPQIIPRHDNPHDAQIVPFIGITPLQAQNAAIVLGQFLVCSLNLLLYFLSLPLSTGEGTLGLGRKAAGPAFGGCRYLQGTHKKNSVFEDDGTDDLDERLRIPVVVEWDKKHMPQKE